MRLINGVSFIAFMISEDIFAFLEAGKMQSFRKYLGRQLPPLGKVIRVDSIKIANEVRGHAGTRRWFIAYPIRVT